MRENDSSQAGHGERIDQAGDEREGEKDNDRRADFSQHGFLLRRDEGR
jgi:hypothetical protein